MRAKLNSAEMRMLRWARDIRNDDVRKVTDIKPVGLK